MQSLCPLKGSRKTYTQRGFQNQHVVGPKRKKRENFGQRTNEA